MKLYGFPPSPNTRKVQAVAVHLGEHPGMVRADRGVTRMARDSAEDVMHYRYPLREKRRCITALKPSLTSRGDCAQRFGASVALALRFSASLIATTASPVQPGAT